MKQNILWHCTESYDCLILNPMNPKEEGIDDQQEKAWERKLIQC